MGGVSAWWWSTGICPNHHHHYHTTYCQHDVVITDQDTRGCPYYCLNRDWGSLVVVSMLMLRPGRMCCWCAISDRNVLLQDVLTGARGHLLVNTAWFYE